MKNIENNYELVTTLEFTVPNDYQHQSLVYDIFKIDWSKIDLDELIDFEDEDFDKTTDKLIAGNKYNLKIFKVVLNSNIINYKIILKFLKKQKALLVNAQGLLLVWRICSLSKLDFWRKGDVLISLDKKRRLPINQYNLHRKIPVIWPYDYKKFDLISFDNGCNPEATYFISITKIENK